MSDLHMGECRFTSHKSGSSLTMTVHDYAQEFQFVIRHDADGPESQTAVCALRPAAAQALRDCLNVHFKAAPPPSAPKDLAERLTSIIEVISKEPKPNHLAMIGFIAGYFGYRIAP